MKNYHNLKKAAMNLSCLVLIMTLFTSLAFSSNSNGQGIKSSNITIERKIKHLDQIIGEIEKQTDYKFFYEDQQISKENYRVVCDNVDGSVFEILSEVANQTGLAFRQVNNTIAIRKEITDEDIAEDVVSVQPQTKSITGKVIDSKGLPLPGVSIVIKGTTTGVTTDFDGNYTMEVPVNAEVLVFSFVGMQNQEIVIGNQSQINVTLREEAINLSEVVAIGYAVQQKKDLTGAVATVKVDDLVSEPVAGVDQMMQGHMAGVNVVSDNSPGGGVAVRVRGYSTIRNNDPLYVIDGVPVESGINLINPNDIESLQILKDASSASIYGSRAANGVVIITTKKGKQGEPQIHFDAYNGIQTAARKLDVLNAQEYGDMLWEAHYNDGKTPSSDIYGTGSTAVIPEYLDANNRVPSDDVNWVDEIMQSALVQSYNLSLSKGSDKSNQTFSVGYFDQEGIVKYTDFKRLTARLNSEYKFFDRLTIAENLSVSHSWSTQATTNHALSSVVYAAYKYPSVAPVKDLDGNYAGAFINDMRNPLASLYYSQDDTRKRLKIFGNAYAELEIIDGLKAKSNFGVDFGDYYFRNFNPKYQETGAQNPTTISTLSTTNSKKFTWIWTNTLNYSKVFDKHKIDGFAGVEAIETNYEVFSASREGFAYEDDNFRYLDAGDSGTQKNSGSGSNSSLVSYFGKVDYNYADRYLFAFTFRRDGSSKLGNNRWGNFPALSAGWRVSEEDFFTTDKISNLKLRFGWGQNGNQDVPAYATIESYYSNTTHSNYAINGDQTSVSTGYSQTRNGNPDLKWETSTQTNIGVDLGLIDNRFTITADYFIKKTEDLLLERPLPPIAGGTIQTVWDNVGEMENKGFELVFDYQSEQNGDFSWNANLNLAHVKNELTDLPDDVNFIAMPSSYLHSVNFDQETSRSVVGQPIASFYGYKSLGIFQNQAEIDAHQVQPNAQPGDLKFEDVSGDGVLDGEDRTFIGSPHPDLTFGLNLGFNYKNFDVQAFFNGSIGNDIYDMTRYMGDFFNSSAYNKFARTAEAWSENNTGSSVPRLSLDDPNNNIRPSSYFVSDGSYMRLKTLTVGYNFKEFAQKIHSSNLRVYVQAQNLFTITGYEGMDPEVGLQSYSSDSRNLDIGVDRGLYPTARTFLIGVNVGF